MRHNHGGLSMSGFALTLLFLFLIGLPAQGGTYNQPIGPADEARALWIGCNDERPGISIPACTRIITEQFPLREKALAHGLRGHRMFDSNKIDEALRDYNASLSIEVSALAINGRANVYAKRGQSKLAIGEYKRALALDGQNGVILKNIAFTYFDMKQFENADVFLTRHIALFPHDGYSYFKRAMARDELGRQGDALADFDKAAYFMPRFPDSFFNAADCTSLPTIGTRQGWISTALLSLIQSQPSRLTRAAVAGCS
jgi:tetratricopeptide (TPR) repeat protein